MTWLPSETAGLIACEGFYFLVHEITPRSSGFCENRASLCLIELGLSVIRSKNLNPAQRKTWLSQVDGTHDVHYRAEGPCLGTPLLPKNVIFHLPMELANPTNQGHTTHSQPGAQSGFQPWPRGCARPSLSASSEGHGRSLGTEVSHYCSLSAGTEQEINTGTVQAPGILQSKFSQKPGGDTAGDCPVGLWG